MKPVIYLSVLGLAVQTAQAQENQFEIIVDAVHVRNSQTALPITLMNEGEVRAEASVSIGETLSSQPGINNASFGPAVGQPVIRGQQGRRVMNLTNGMPNADASGNSPDHATTVEPMLATGVEILRGPSTLLYGGGAIGGVVNVIDNRFSTTVPASSSFAVESRHGSAADMNTLVTSATFPAGNLVWHVDFTQRDWNDVEIPGLAIHPAYLDEHEGEEEEPGEHEEVENTDGYIANSRGETRAGTLSLSYVLDAGFLGFSVNRMENEYGLPPGVHGGHHEEEEGFEAEEEHEDENIFIDMKRNRYDFLAQMNNVGPFLETVNYRLSHTDYEHAEMEGPGIAGTRFSNESWGQRLQLTHPDFGDWHGVLGLQHNSETFGAVGEESFIPTTDIASSGIFLVEALHTSRVTYEFGFRLNQDRLDPQDAGVPDIDFNTFSYSASALWDANSLASLGASLSHSERAPSVEELYSNFGLSDIEDCVIHFANGSCELGDVSLGEEASNNIDLSLYLTLRNMEATFTVFYNSFDDYIFKNNTGLEVDELPVRAYQNEGADFYGMEVDLSYFINNDWELRIFGDTVSGELNDGGAVPLLPPYRLGSDLNFSGTNFTAGLSVLHAFDQNDPGLNEISTSSYTRWDFEVDYAFDNSGNGELLLFSKLRNLTDEEIRLSTSLLRGYTPESGRSLEVGVRYSF